MTLAALFAPESVVVIGASSTAENAGTLLLRRLRNARYAGAVNVLHPSANEIAGFATTPLAALERVDYGFVSLPAPAIAPTIAQLSGRLRFLHVHSAGFRESGVEGMQLERNMVQAASQAGIRIVGPNSLGIYSSPGRLPLMDDPPFAQPHTARVPGVGLAAQSGGLMVETIRRLQAIGVPVTAAISLGNCADVGIVETIEHYLADPVYAVIGIYVESIDDGPALLRALGAARGRKPVVILKGGKSAVGHRAAAAHTGALAQPLAVWRAAAAKTGAVLAETLTQFVAALTALTLHAGVSRAAASDACLVVGMGGGLGVLACDALAAQGFEVFALDPQLGERLADLALPVGFSLANPVDIPGNIFRRRGGGAFATLVRRIHADRPADNMLLYVNPDMLREPERPLKAVEEVLGACGAVWRELGSRTHLAMVLRPSYYRESWWDPQSLLERAGVRALPLFSDFGEAVFGLHALRTFALHQEMCRT